MSFKEEFAEILEKKMGSPLKKEDFKTPYRSQLKSSMDWILPIFAPRKTWAPKEIPSAYPKVFLKTRPKTPQTEVRSVEKESSENTYKRTQLSEKGQKAFKIFLRLGAQFSKEDSCNLHELKGQYRRLARIYHPDSQNSMASSKHFNMCSVCYKLLSKELTELSGKK